jgi:hypothetical protein
METGMEIPVLEIWKETFILETDQLSCISLVLEVISVVYVYFVIPAWTEEDKLQLISFMDIFA